MLNKTTKGFTLIELAIVLGIMAIISTGVFVSFRGSERRELQNASLALQADLRYAQRRAIMEGRRYGIIFEVQHNRYHIVLDSPRQTIRTIYLPNRVRLLEVSGPSLMFLPRGTASSGFRITLHNGPYSQQLTATVSGGRIRSFDIIRA